MRSGFTSRPGPHLWSHAQLQAADANAIKGDVRLLDETGQISIEILGLRFQSLAGTARENPEDWLYEFQWQPQGTSE